MWCHNIRPGKTQARIRAGLGQKDGEEREKFWNTHWQNLVTNWIVAGWDYVKMAPMCSCKSWPKLGFRKECLGKQDLGTGCGGPLVTVLQVDISLSLHLWSEIKGWAVLQGHFSISSTKRSWRNVSGAFLKSRCIRPRYSLGLRLTALHRHCACAFQQFLLTAIFGGEWDGPH